MEAPRVLELYVCRPGPGPKGGVCGCGDSLVKVGESGTRREGLEIDHGSVGQTVLGGEFVPDQLTCSAKCLDR